MDRFAAYIPGWEMPKNSSSSLTSRYGFITDYLAEAFHYQFKHTNRYEEVNRRLRLGKAVEGRDEKGIKKTVSAFVKILHPDGPARDQEMDEYVAYATECRRRVKEQMNKRKPDDEFAQINLSYINADGKDVVVFCPESKDVSATQQPQRQKLSVAGQFDNHQFGHDPKVDTAAYGTLPPEGTEVLGANNVTSELTERHFTILYGETGHSYESILSPYLRGAKEVVIEDPYIRLPHQIQNFVRFCEVLLKAGTIKKVTLVTGYDDKTQLSEMSDKLEDLKQSLLEMDVLLEIRLNSKMHDREIRLDNGWVVKIGRGLDFYQKPASWYEIGASDLSLRKCLETKVDIFHQSNS